MSDASIEEVDPVERRIFLNEEDYNADQPARCACGKRANAMMEDVEPVCGLACAVVALSEDFDSLGCVSHDYEVRQAWKRAAERLRAVVRK